MVVKLLILLLGVSFAEANFTAGAINFESGKDIVLEAGEYTAREEIQIDAGQDILLKNANFKAGDDIEFTAGRLFKAAEVAFDAPCTTITAITIEIADARFTSKTTLSGTATLSKVDIKGTLVVSGGCKAKHLTAPSLTVTDDGDRELFLSGNSKIGGDIVFRGKPGLVHLSAGASVEGSVRNGKLKRVK